ncbi:MAG: DUF4190 domain-containing protein [Halomonas sp.]|nr:DUF4190 domain-containing protein [Halomonas sp.]
MDGWITAFDDATQEGLIADGEGREYPFTLGDWRGRGLPGPDIAVRFDVRGARAAQVINLPEKQRRATARVVASISEPVASGGTPLGKRHSGWAIAAVIVAMLGLFFDVLAPFIGTLAGILAVVGLRQIRRDPQRYKGRAFCWAAIALALGVAMLSLLVESAPASSTFSTVAAQQAYPG